MSDTHIKPLQQVIFTTELLEHILLALDSQTLLLSQRTNKRFRDVIKASQRIQKKLYFIQPTFEEAIEYRLITNESLVVSVSSEDVTLFNPLTFLISNDQRHHPSTGSTQHYAVLRDNIASESLGQWSSSWERMYCRTRATHAEGTQGLCDFSTLVEDSKIVNPHPRVVREDDGDDDDNVFEFYECGDWKRNPLRSAMRKVQANAVGDMGIHFDWAATKLNIWGTLSTYKVWEKLCHLAHLEGTPEWEKLSIWTDERSFPPTEDIIDEELGRHATKGKARSSEDESE